MVERYSFPTMTFELEADCTYTQSKLSSRQAEHLGLAPSHYSWCKIGYSEKLFKSGLKAKGNTCDGIDMAEVDEYVNN